MSSLDLRMAWRYHLAMAIEKTTQGQWNAYVEAGKDLDEQRKRFEEVPERFRAGANGHMATVIRLRAASRTRR